MENIKKYEKATIESVRLMYIFQVPGIRNSALRKNYK